jgi:hypothetical protein
MKCSRSFFISSTRRYLSSFETEATNQADRSTELPHAFPEDQSDGRNHPAVVQEEEEESFTFVNAFNPPAVVQEDPIPAARRIVDA